MSAARQCPGGCSDAPLLTLDDLAEEVNPVLRGWLTYFTAFYPSAVTLIGRRMDRHLMRWARRKYKRLERSEKRTRAWLRGVRQRSPDLFAHWALRYTCLLYTS